MVLKKRRPVSAGTRHRVDLVAELSENKPEKNLSKILPKRSGRNVSGKVTVRHQGGRQKRLWRKIDYKRDKRDIQARVVSIEYDPNRTANIALLYYQDGEKRYILAPKGLLVGEKVVSGQKAAVKPGNSLPLKRVPVGTPIHNLEIKPGKGGQLVRGAGTAALLQSKEEGKAVVKLPSGELKKFSLACFATIGQIGNVHQKNIKYGKAGRKRLLGIRPAVRGVAMAANAHPHGGGRGRSGVGHSSPKSPWGKKTRGKKTRRKKKYSNKHIIRDRRR